MPKSEKKHVPRPLNTYDIMRINFHPCYSMEYCDEVKAGSTASALAKYLTDQDHFSPQQVFHTQTNYCGTIDAASYFHKRDDQVVLYIAKRLQP